jgi:predicted nuclease of predicted toxin-antitoxin system
VKFLIDAQLPETLVNLFIYKGFEALHTSSLPQSNRTSDKQLLHLAANENYIIVTKDKDFLDYFLINKQPKQLLFIRTGNIPNIELTRILSNNLTDVAKQFEHCQLIEITKEEIILRV